ncbi:MAG: Crp/Fnr family transcriptional regulator [Prevotella sp.]|nr:Crp/Fnr family transcriptional regulator [Prevotella sp.]
MENVNSIFERLLLLPLFQGMNNADLTTLAGQTKFGFHRFAEGKEIIRDGSPCLQLCFLMSGTLSTTAVADDHGYSVTEQVTAPAILQPERIFGLTQLYTRSYTALSACNCMTLDKSEVLRLMEEYVVFRINLLNIVSTQSQRLQRRLWHQQPRDLDQRIIRFFEAHCLHPAGPKTLRIKMTRLAEELNDSRLNVSRALNRMQADGLISLHREHIEIPDMRRLLG